MHLFVKEDGDECWHSITVFEGMFKGSFSLHGVCPYKKKVADFKCQEMMDLYIRVYRCVLSCQHKTQFLGLGNDLNTVRI